MSAVTFSHKDMLAQRHSAIIAYQNKNGKKILTRNFVCTAPRVYNRLLMAFLFKEKPGEVFLKHIRLGSGRKMYS